MYLFQFPQIMFPIHDRLYCCQGAVYQRLREMIVPFWVPSTFLANSVSFMRNSLPTGPPLTVPVNVVTIIMLFARYYFSWASFVENTTCYQFFSKRLLSPPARSDREVTEQDPGTGIGCWPQESGTLHEGRHCHQDFIKFHKVSNGDCLKWVYWLRVIENVPECTA